MCQYCESKTVKPIDMMMGNKESFNFFSAAAIEEAMRQTSGAPMFCMPICAEHQAMISGESAEESEEANHDGEGPDGDGDDDDDDEYDGT